MLLQVLPLKLKEVYALTILKLLAKEVFIREIPYELAAKYIPYILIKKSNGIQHTVQLTVDLHPSMFLATFLQWYICSASAHHGRALRGVRRRSAHSACQLNKCTAKEVSLRTYCSNPFTVSHRQGSLLSIRFNHNPGYNQLQH